jgi:transcriptional regulator with XRE-family HTH domain
MRVRKLLGQNIRRLRMEAGLSQTQLGGLADLNTGRVSDYERGVYAASVDIIERIADALGVPVAELFADTAVPRALKRSKNNERPKARSAKPKRI